MCHVLKTRRILTRYCIKTPSQLQIFIRPCAFSVCAFPSRCSAKACSWLNPLISFKRIVTTRKKPAERKAIRGTVDPGYLCYTLGKQQVLKFRHDYQKQEGVAYSLQTFHDEVRRNGCPPIRLLLEIALKNRTKRDGLFGSCRGQARG